MVPFIVAKITTLQPLGHLLFATAPKALAAGTTRLDTYSGWAMIFASAYKVQSLPNLFFTVVGVSCVSRLFTPERALSKRRVRTSTCATAGAETSRSTMVQRIREYS